MVGSIKLSEIEQFETFRRDEHRQILVIRLINSKIWNMGSISFRKHEMEIWNMRSIPSKEYYMFLIFETLILRNQETSKLAIIFI